MKDDILRLIEEYQAKIDVCTSIIERTRSKDIKRVVNSKRAAYLKFVQKLNQIIL